MCNASLTLSFSDSAMYESEMCKQRYTMGVGERGFHGGGEGGAGRTGKCGAIRGVTMRSPQVQLH